MTSFKPTKSIPEIIEELGRISQMISDCDNAIEIRHPGGMSEDDVKIAGTPHFAMRES